jgi:hypothetical protein
LCLVLLPFGQITNWTTSSFTFKLLIILHICFGLGGVFLAKYSAGIVNTLLPAYLPATLLLFAAKSDFVPKEKSISIFFSCASFILILGIVLTANGRLPSNAILNFTYEKVYILVLALTFFAVKKSYSILIAILFGTIVVFRIYPALSWIVCLMAPLVVYISARAHSKVSIIFRNLLLLIISFSSLLSIVLWNRLQGLASLYYQAVDKSNNLDYRAFLLDRSIYSLRENFWFGTNFENDIAVSVIGDSKIVAHNDAANILASGGFFSLTVLNLIIFITLKTGFDLLSKQKLSELDSRLMYSVMTALIAFVFLSSSLAMLSKPNNSFFFYSMIFTTHAIARKYRVH